MKQTNLYRRILAGALSLLLCGAMLPAPAFAADNNPYDIMITSGSATVEKLSEGSASYKAIQEAAEERNLGIQWPGLGFYKDYGQLFSPFTMTSDNSIVSFTMTTPELPEDSMEAAVAEALGKVFRIAVQNATDPSAPVIFYPAEEIENGTLSITIPVNGTVNCALAQFDTEWFNNTGESDENNQPIPEDKTPVFVAINETEQPVQILENREDSTLSYTWTYRIGKNAQDNIAGVTDSMESYVRVLVPSPLSLDTTSIDIDSSVFSKGAVEKESSQSWIIQLIPKNERISEEELESNIVISFDAVLPYKDFEAGQEFVISSEIVMKRWQTSELSGVSYALSETAPLQSVEATSAVTITPADMTIYQGGDEGYEGVYDNGIEGSNSLPHPLFKITPASGSSVTNPTQLTFTNDGKSWTVVSAGDDYYYFVAASGQDPVRVTYTDKDGTQVTDDEFDVSWVGNTYAEYTIDLYPGDNNFNDVRAKTDTNQEGWPISVNSGKLTVRAVEKETDATSDIVKGGTPAEDGSVSYDGEVSAGSAVAVVPENTTYTLNNTDVQLPDDHGASLLFDDIISSDGKGGERIEKLEAAADAWLDENAETASGTRDYQIKYLDLVDAHNGNAWIKANNSVTIYWGYPDGTDQSTNFKLLHFEDLHRDTSGSDSTGFNPDDIAQSKIEEVTVTNQPNGISFTVEPGGFSPFVLVWDAAPTTYIITASAEGGGTISPNGSVTVTEGDSQTFAITPNNGYHIEDVLVDGVSVGAVSTYTFSNVTANHTITATFERNSLPIHYYTITATAGEGGAIAPDGTVRVAQGADRTFTISAAEGYVIADVLVDGESIGAVDSYTFENVRQNHTIEARFQPVSGVADPDDTGVSDWLNTDDHLAYLDGYPDNTFQPEEDMTRAEAAQMFYNLLRDQDVDTTVSFTDVAADAWYAEAVNTLATLEIVDGVGDNRFAPERTITRAEFTTMAMRFCQEIPTGENIFSDVDQDDWFYDYVVGSIQYGWINGYPDGTFRPNDTITRAEVTTIANRMLGRAADEAYVDGHQDQLRAFPDVTKGYWAYYDITEATNAHTYTQDSQGEDWTGLA